MAKVVIGITGNEKEIPAMSGIKYTAVARDFSEAVIQAGGLPMIIPISQPDLAKDYIDSIDKLILSGGQHVVPHFYGEEKTIDSEDYFPERDEFELALIREALRQNKPIFGICRGMQLLNVALGGTLHQAIDHHWQEEMIGTSHSLQIRPNSRVSQLFRQGTSINSFHRQSIKDLASNLQVTARDPRDGTIEAYESQDYALLGIQWHPELLAETNQNNQKLFDYLVQSL